MIREQQKSIDKIKSMLIQILGKTWKEQEIKTDNYSTPTPTSNTRKGK